MLQVAEPYLFDKIFRDLVAENKTQLTVVPVT